MKKAKIYFIGLWLVLFFIMESVLDVIERVVTTVHTWFKEITKGIESKYDELKLKDEPDSGKVK